MIGQGSIGPRHADAVLKVPDATLTCIVDRHPQTIAGAARYKCPKFTLVQATVEGTIAKLDVTIVCTPNNTYTTVPEKLLQVGVHVLCEKPISIDIASGYGLVWCTFKAFLRYSV